MPAGAIGDASHSRLFSPFTTWIDQRIVQISVRSSPDPFKSSNDRSAVSTADHGDLIALKGAVSVDIVETGEAVHLSGSFARRSFVRC
jgi:hypothetical protein